MSRLTYDLRQKEGGRLIETRLQGRFILQEDLIYKLCGCTCLTDDI